MKNSWIVSVMVSVSIYTVLAGALQTITLSRPDISLIGTKIWRNESNCSLDKLVWWNVGERFPSLGICHFIWFPANHQESFTETFPLLLRFLRNNGVQLPAWLATIPPCPWKSREAFFADRKTIRMQSLQTLLANTIELQTGFIIQRLRDALPTLTKNLSVREKVENNFALLARTPQGMYALIDYTHFKGEGTNPNERYNGQGWGLLQVLENMRVPTRRQNPLQEFVASARKLLTVRVFNSPPERNEKKWLAGWHKRVAGYVG